jgi:hypothetical protein
VRTSSESTASASGRAEVIAWRIDRLRAAGFDRRLARRVAIDGRYDLHALLDLIDRGCTPPLAIRILAPLEGEVSR